MTKEKLRNEAREYLTEHSEYSEVFEETFVAVDTLTAMVDFAEPREKRIEELEAQIEKMKCCSNCENWNWKHNKCEKKLKGDCFKHSKWVMRNF